MFLHFHWRLLVGLRLKFTFGNCDVNAANRIMALNRHQLNSNVAFSESVHFEITAIYNLIMVLFTFRKHFAQNYFNGVEIFSTLTLCPALWIF